ncbi:MAG TPA: response regulator [Smithellaceae bacterium]|nr:response regulator [Smithellaceae bacterium]
MTTLNSLTKIHKRILVVDDDPAILDVLTQYMKLIGLDAVSAASGEEALAAFKKNHFDIVVSDIKMANMDGLTLLGEVKRLDPDVIFIVITGYPSIETVLEAMKKGAVDYIVKPFQFDEIKHKIERALVEKDMNKQLRSNQGIIWSLIISIPVWLILGIILAKVLMD